MSLAEQTAAIAAEMRSLVARHALPARNQGALNEMTGLANRARRLDPRLGESARRVISAADEFWSAEKHIRRRGSTDAAFARLHERIDRLEKAASILDHVDGKPAG